MRCTVDTAAKDLKISPYDLLVRFFLKSESTYMWAEELALRFIAKWTMLPDNGNEYYWEITKDRDALPDGFEDFCFEEIIKQEASEPADVRIAA